MSYSMRFNEDLYDFVAPIRRLNRFRTGQRVLYSGSTNYTYYEGGHKCVAHKEKATIIGKSENNVVLKLDNYRQPYRTKSVLPLLNAIDVIPPHQYAVVTECDLACGDKVIDTID